ncbi:MAG: CapA family protein [Cyclobacteriaceae bacterium]|nr:CapA family protein [Cyclobacteriaceae bacterium]
MGRFKSVLLFLILSLPASAQDTLRLSLLFVGDFMQHDSNIAAAYDAQSKKYNYASCFEYVAPIVRSADLAIGNLELTLAGSPYKGYPQFSAPDALAIELKRIGMDILVTANNHSLDRRRKGLERTLKVLDSLEILHTGTFRDSLERSSVYPLLVEKNGFMFSLLNYTYGTNGIAVTKPNIVNLIDTVEIKADLEKARSQHSDAIIVFMHWGIEYQSLPNQEQKKLAALCLRGGAKLVIGSHPHVLQPMVWNKSEDQLIAYSLGNFVSGQRPRYRDGGAMLWVELQKVSRQGISVTSIKKAEYELEWVQKWNDDFKMFPLRYFDGDTVLIKAKSMRDAFTLFSSDSRALLDKHNVNIEERRAPKIDTMVYSIKLNEFESDSLILESPILKFYGLERFNNENSETQWFAGRFYDYELARQALADIYAKTIFRRSRIVRRVEIEEPD